MIIITAAQEATFRAALAAIEGELARKRATEEDRRALTERLGEVREKSKSFHSFLKEAWPILEPTTPFKDNWHLAVVAEHLELITRGEITRLQINEPPGMMKSLQTSVMWPAWEWGPANFPGLRYFTTSYREDYAIRDARRMRDLVKSEWYQTLWPMIKLERDGEKEFENNFRGSRKAVPFQSLTAGRGNRVIIDDPHSVDTVESPVDRAKITMRFRESVTSRLNDPEKDAIIVIMHRLHPQDVCGVIEELGLPYVKLVLPMEYTRSLTVSTPWFNDPRKAENELLFPDRMSRKTLEDAKLELGPHAYDTQFAQRARAREGSYFFSEENVLEEVVGPGDVKSYAPSPMPTSLDAVFSVIDTATKIGRGRDGTGAMHIGYQKFPVKKVFVIDWELTQMNADVHMAWLPSVLARGEELARETGARSGYKGAVIEDKDSGQVLIMQAAKDAKMRSLVRPIPSEFTALGKDGRAVSISGHVYRGLVKFAEPAYRKTSVYKGRKLNHAFDQVTTFRMAQGTPLDEDELFDCFCYGVGLTLGDVKGL